ncbi:RodZ domain-containing protein [Sulfuriflexus mobilis]|uniref:RodZ domain-containing protein n=1 Tax=Sulfuriflexus mobilis TaxID=1811807 RepID=UPI000F82C0B2|nr:RodZ domain-containing protein [Sulfuriflexus mobilis]
MSDTYSPELKAGSEASFSFGQRLSSARRALNLSQEQVAASLRLNVSLIKAIEEENYANLPAPMYIAGYLRNYARLLKIPVEPLLAALDMERLDSPPLIAKAHHRRRVSRSGLWVKLFALILLLVLAAGLFNWFQSQDFNWQVLSQPDDGNARSEAELPPIIEETIEQPIKHPVEPLTETAEVEKVQALSSDALEAAVPQVEAITDLTQSPNIEPRPQNIPAPVVLAEGVAGTGVSLILKFNEDCWIEIKDAKGKTLAYDLYREGQVKQIRGIAPFNVFLGNARAVEIEYNGEAYDASAFIQGNLARFQLGSVDDNEGTIE